MSGDAPPDGRPGGERLARVIGARALALACINIVVGAGIFGLPALIAADLGRAAVLAYLLCALVVGSVTLCFAEIGSRVARSGGLYAYAHEAFGPLVGAVTGNLLWFGNGCVSNAAVAALAADTVGHAVPALAAPPARAALLVTAYVIFAAIQLRGARSGAAASELFSAAKVAPLVLLAVAGLATLGFGGLALEFRAAPRAVGHATVVLFFAFMGTEAVLGASGEVRDPARNIPRGVLAAVGSIAILYLALQLVAQAALGDRLAGSGAAPLAETAAVVLGPWGRGLILVTSVTAMLGLVAGDLLGSPRVLYALAEDRLLPRPLAAVHPVRRIPHVAVVTYAALACLLALTGTFRALVTLSASATLLVYLVTCLGVLRLRRTRPDAGGFRAPGGAVLPIAAAALIAYLLASLARVELLALGALGGGLLAAYATLRPWARPAREGE